MNAVRTFGACLAISVLVGALAMPVLAEAATGYAYLGGFGCDPAPAPHQDTCGVASTPSSADGRFDQPRRVAVQEATGNVYVVDKNNDRIQVFSPSGSGGSYLTQFGSGVIDDPIGIAINQANGDVYVSDVDDVVKFTSDGASTPTFTRDLGFSVPGVTGPMAFDQSSGELVVADQVAGLVRRFTAGGVAAGAGFDGATSGTPFSALKDVAVDDAGDVLVVDDARVLRFGAAGDFKGTFDHLPKVPDLVATVPGSTDVLVAHNGAYFEGELYRYINDNYRNTYRNTDGSFDGNFGGLTVRAGRLYLSSEQIFGFAGTTGVLVFDAFTVEVPQIADETADSSETGVTLRGSIDSNREATTYHFEYGATSAYGRRLPAGQEASIPASPSPAAVAKTLGGLEPGTTYHFRLVASNLGGAAEGPDQTFTTTKGGIAQQPADGCPNAAIRAQQGAQELVDCRAWEQASPSNKANAELNVDFGALPATFLTVAAPTGAAVGFEAFNAFAGSENGGTLQDYAARRGEGSWTTSGLNPLGHGRLSNASLIGRYSEDISHAIVAAYDPPLASGAAEGRVNLYQEDLATKTFRTLTLNTPDGAPATEPRLVGASADLSKIVFADSTARTPAAPDGSNNFYLWQDGVLALVSVLPDGSPASSASATLPGRTTLIPNAVSRDGRRVFFVTDDGRIYVRSSGTSTTELTLSAKVTPDAHQPASLWSATPDGEFAFFTTAEQLVDSDTDSSNDLYRVRVSDGQLTRLTGGSSSGGADVSEVGRVSDDGSHVYFSAAGVFDDAPGGQGSKAYLRGQASVQHLPSGVDVGVITDSRTRISGDGRSMLFISSTKLTELPTGGMEQVYRYDSETQHATCLSCRSDGGPSEVALLAPEFRDQSFFQQAQVSQWSLSEDGRRAFFSTAAPLARGDTNGEVDAYEYSDGKASLISSGRSEDPSYFQDASSDGDTVFVATRERLTGTDIDGSYDVYAARVNGGFAEPAATSPCAGDACQGRLVAPSAAADLPSSARTAQGDALAPVRARVSVVRQLTASQRRTLAHGGKVALTVRVSKSGTVHVRGRARVGGSQRTVLAVSRAVKRAGVVRLTMRLSRGGSQALAKHKSLRISVRITFETGRAASFNLVLRSAR